MKLSRRTTVIAFILVVLFWSSAFSAIKISLSYAPPLLFAGIRTLLGGVILFAIAVSRGGPLNLRSTWSIILIASVLSVSLFFAVQSYSLEMLPSGLGAVLVYLQPILVGFFAWLWLGESLTFSKVFGLLLGFLGVAAVSVGGLSGQLSLPGIFLGVLSAVSWAVGTVYFKKVQEKVDMFWLVSGQFLAGGVTLLILGTFVESWSQVEWTPVFWYSLLYSAVFGISLAWLLYMTLLKAGEASRISALLFVVPLLSVIIGHLILGEAITFSILVGAVLVVSGIYLVNRRRRAALEGECETA